MSGAVASAAHKTSVGRMSISISPRMAALGNLNRRVDRVQQGAVAGVLPARTHVVGDVAESYTRLRIAITERTAGAEMAEATRVGSERTLGLRQLEADAEAAGTIVDDVVAVDLFGGRGGDGARAQDSNAVDLAAIGERGIDPRNA